MSTQDAGGLPFVRYQDGGRVHFEDDQTRDFVISRVEWPEGLE
jgi:hypothetical protein